MEAQEIDEKVTVVNPTKWPVHVTLTSAAPGGDEQSSDFGPIEPGGRASGTIAVRTDGAFTVVASWTPEAGGPTVSSRPFTAQLSPDEPVTPVTCTLNVPYDSGSMGVWSSVEWEMPPGTR